MTSSVFGPRRSSKTLPKAKLAPKKRSWSLFGGLPVWLTAPVMDLLESESWRNHRIWEVRSAGGWDALNTAAGAGQQKGPASSPRSAWPPVAQATRQTLTRLSCKVLPRPPHSPDLSLTCYHFFKRLNNCWQRKCFHNQQDAENAFQEFVESPSMDFFAMENSYFFLAKMCWL